MSHLKKDSAITPHLVWRNVSIAPRAVGTWELLQSCPRLVYHDRESRRRPSHHVIRHHRPSKDSSIGTDADSIRNSKNLVRDSNCPPCPPCGSKRTSAASQDDTRQQSASGSVTKTSANDRERSLTKDDEECEEAIKMATKVCRKDCSAKEAGDVGSAATRPPKSSKRRRSESSDECKPKPRVEECLLSDDEEESTKAGTVKNVSYFWFMFHLESKCLVFIELPDPVLEPFLTGLYFSSLSNPNYKLTRLLLKSFYRIIVSNSDTYFWFLWIGTLEQVWAGAKMHPQFNLANA